MGRFFKVFLLGMCLYGGQASFAGPEEDANYIAHRSYDPAYIEVIESIIKESFISVYFEPIAAFNVDLIDEDRFAELIPDADVTPYLDRYFANLARTFSKAYSAEQLAQMASILRANEDLSTAEAFLAEREKREEAAIAQARARAVQSESDDPGVLQLQETVVQLDAVSLILEDGGAEDLGSSVAFGLGMMMELVRYMRAIDFEKRDFENPVTLAALEADGILGFTNRIQRQDLLDRFSVSEETSGIRFIKPTVSYEALD